MQCLLSRHCNHIMFISIYPSSDLQDTMQTTPCKRGRKRTLNELSLAERISGHVCMEGDGEGERKRRRRRGELIAVQC